MCFLLSYRVIDFSFTWRQPLFKSMRVAAVTLLEAWAQKSHSITLVTFDWPKQATKPAEIQGVEK